MSRLTLFVGVEKLGSVHTATLGVSEVLVTVFFSMLFLRETLVTQQWAGAALMTLSVALLAAEKDIPSLIPIPLLPWAIELSVSLQRRRQR